ncbi:MAG: DUF5665 domain-containing protein [Candidatus Peribacteraceae bacterium]|nr:DUF5665 domain-containing protein [Candidatus Peribacteraceae bacterium]
MPHTPPRDERLTKTLQHLDASVAHLQSALHRHRRPWDSFYRGILYGLGMIVAFAIIVPVIIAMLRMVEWVPLVGDFLTNVIIRMEDNISAVKRY